MNYKEQLVQKYGGTILTDLELVRTAHYFTLVDVAKNHGFSREAARQIFLKLYGTPYGEVQKDLRMNIDQTVWNAKRGLSFHRSFSCWVYLTQARAEDKFIERCKNLRIDLIPPTKVLRYFQINNLNVRVRSASGPIAHSKNRRIRYFRLYIRLSERKLIDYFALYISPLDIFYIIPNSDIPASNWFYIPEKETSCKNSKNKHLKYKEAWYQLKE